MAEAAQLNTTDDAKTDHELVITKSTESVAELLLIRILIKLLMAERPW